MSGADLPKVLVIVGPTASGKTKLAVALARRFNGEIISADSRQVYRGMDVGTGKDLNEYKSKIQNPKSKISYHLIDVASPRRQFTVAEYQRRAYRAIQDILRHGKLPIICGGTGLYVDAVVAGYQLPKIRNSKFEIRNFRRRLQRLPLPQLLHWLNRVDAVTYRIIDRKNRRLIERALEIYYQTGKPKSAQLKKKPPPYEFLLLGVRVPKAVLQQRIARRLKQRLRQGLVAEVIRLHRQGISWRRLEALGLEYRWVSRYLCGQVDRQTMEQHLLREIKDFARRQMTWFRRNSSIHWVSSLRQARRLATSFLRPPSSTAGLIARLRSGGA